MKDLTVRDILNICHGSLVSGDDTVICKTFTKDTRTLLPGDTYIGIKGEKFDGNLFYKDAFLKKANCVILEESSFNNAENEWQDKPIILVKDAKLALKQLAEYKRKMSSATFIGVTGSVGKTSTKDLIYSVVSQNESALKTEGNYNNNIGLPLTLLRLNDEKVAVIEMGMNALGEIDYLSKITRPNISVITNVGTAHIGELGSRENILKAKLEILNGMDEQGILIINNDNDLLHQYYLDHPQNIMTVGINNNSDVMASDLELLEDESRFTIHYQDKTYQMTCPVPGIAFVYNSLVAFLIGMLMHIDISSIKKGIENFSLTKNRMEISTTKNNITIINDVYNASVDSMKSSLEILKNRNCERRIAVLGSMLELGSFSKELHETVGEEVWKNHIDVLVTIGDDALFIGKKAEMLGMPAKNIHHFTSNEDAISYLKKSLKPKDAILLKASNSLHFIEIVDALKEN